MTIKHIINSGKKSLWVQHWLPRLQKSKKAEEWETEAGAKVRKVLLSNIHSRWLQEINWFVIVEER